MEAKMRILTGIAVILIAVSCIPLFDSDNLNREPVTSSDVESYQYSCDYMNLSTKEGIAIHDMSLIEDLKKHFTNEKTFLLYNNHQEALLELKDAAIFSQETEYIVNASFRYTMSTITPVAVIRAQAQDAPQKIGRNRIASGQYELVLKGTLYFRQENNWQQIPIVPNQSNFFEPSDKSPIKYIEFEEITIQ